MANEKQMDSELIEELQQRLEALNNEGVMDAGVIDGFLTAYALNPEHPSKHDIYPYIFSEEGDPAALPEDDRILELLDIRLNEIQAALAAKGGLDPVIFPLVDDNDEIITDEEGIEALEPWASGFFFGMMHWREDLIADEDMVVTITHTGYVKRIPVAAYRAQKRGGKGVSGVNLKEDDVIDEMFIASTHEYVLFFSSKGKVYRLKVHELPVGTRQARGTAIVNLLPFEEGEKIASVISCREFPADEYLMFATKSGMVKKTVMSAYDRSRRDGLIAINLRDDDALLNVRRVREGDKIILATTAGKAIMFSEEQVRATGRDTSGVRGIGMKDGVSVLGMEVTNGNGDLFVITERGYGKRTPVADYPEQNRGGQGVYTIQMTERKGNLAAMKTVGPQHELFIVTEGATVIRVKTDEISQTGRATQGVKMMTVDDNDRICAVARMTAAKEKPEGEGAEAAVDTEEAPVDLGDGNDMPEDLLDE